MSKKLISIVSPVFNEIGALPIFQERLANAIEKCRKNYDFEIIFTNNASTDGSLEFIMEWRAHDEMVNILTLSRNFGYTPSVLAGIHYSNGDAVIVIESDCEDPPELIPKFIAEWEATGCDIIYGIRNQRTEPKWLTLLRKAWYRATSKIADHEFILDMAEFSLFSRRVRDEIVKIQTQFPFIRSEIAYVGFQRKGIPYIRERRVHGKSYLNLLTLMIVAMALTLSVSTFALRLPAYLGGFLILFDFIALASYLSGGLSIDLITLAIVHGIFLTYVLMFVSVYIARIYRNGMNRPTFIIDWQKSTIQEVE